MTKWHDLEGAAKKEVLHHNGRVSELIRGKEGRGPLLGEGARHDLKLIFDSFTKWWFSLGFVVSVSVPRALEKLNHAHRLLLRLLSQAFPLGMFR